jgi:hypothetical protein
MAILHSARHRMTAHDEMRRTYGGMSKQERKRAGKSWDSHHHLERTSAGSSPGRSSGMPSKTRLAPPSAHTRRRAGLEQEQQRTSQRNRSGSQVAMAEARRGEGKEGGREGGEGEGRHRGTIGAARSGGGAG